MTGKNLYLVLYTLVSLVCVFISAYLSYYGYYAHFEEPTLLFAILIALLLFGADMLVRQFRIAQRPLLLPLFFFIVVAIFSGASNFNFLYTKFMEEDIAERELESVFAQYRQDLTETRTRLMSIDAVESGTEERKALDRELQNLRQQITDPRRPGCGERCKEHMQNIHQILGGIPTELKIPSVEAPTEEQLSWFQNYREIVIADFEEGAAPEEYQRVTHLVADIDSLLNKYSNPHELIRQEGGAGTTMFLGPNARDIPQELRNTSYDIERRANALLPVNREVNHAQLRSGLDTIGEIPSSFRDAFIEQPNVGVTVVGSLLAVFVDIIPIFFAFILFGPDARAVQGDQSRYQRSRRVVTR